MIFRAADQPFDDRRHAGRELAAAVSDAGVDDPVVFALPRGGVPVGFEVAAALSAPLFVLVVRKLGAPGNPELAIGAVAGDGTVVLDEALIREMGVDRSYVEAETARQTREVEARVARYGRRFMAPSVAERTVVLVDDGVATGSTTTAALRALRDRSPRELILAVPVASPDVLSRLAELADRCIALRTPLRLFGVGAWYRDFGQTTDAEVLALLESSHRGR